MSRYNFSSEQRIALWRAYDQRCAYCHEPVMLGDLTIDHILPEHLEEKPDELQRIITRFNLGEAFSINDYCNWAPTHFGCNVRKDASVFESAPYYIGIAQSKAARVREEELRGVRRKEFDRCLARVALGIRHGLVSKSYAIGFLGEIHQAVTDRYDPIVVTFGINVSEARDDRVLGQGAPSQYVELCDWLEKDLVKKLESTVSSTFYYPEASTRDGETLSVRLAFIRLDLSELEKFRNGLWEILEVEWYSEIYGTMPDGTQHDLRGNGI